MEFPACLTARIASAEGLQAFFVGVAVLNDDRRDALRELERKPISDGRAIIHDVHRLMNSCG